MSMGRLTITGKSFEIGESLGRIGRPLARRIASEVRRDAFCCRLRETDMPTLLEQVREGFPHLWEELSGIGAGMGLNLEDVFLWNCLQGRLDAAASATVVINRLGYRIILNKRELSPQLAGKCRVIDVHPEGRPGFLSLYIPGCMPGGTFGANRAGVAHVVDPVSGSSSGGDAGKGVPGFIVSRAVLDAGSLADAIDVVMESDRYDSAYHILASTEEFITVAIAATPTERTVAPIPNKHWHTNHFPGKTTAREETDCASSKQRYAALSEMMDNLPSHPTEDDMLSLLESGAARDTEASAIQPTPGNLGTAFIKLHAGRIDLRLFRAADPVRHRYVLTAVPDKPRDTGAQQCECP